ncbi:hypothetical protein HDU92_000062 [Lobulomyces angularis]|nr:hypothetical protein HDU92_000062 [Lobulomyces angularis]
MSKKVKKRKSAKSALSISSTSEPGATKKNSTSEKNKSINELSRVKNFVIKKVDVNQEKVESIYRNCYIEDWRKELPWFHKDRLKFYNFSELPLYLQDNDFIISGYRANYSFKESLISFFHLHNETGNVFTHFISFLIFLIFIFDILIFQCNFTLKLTGFNNLQLAFDDRLIISGGCVSFIFSASFHNFFCGNKKAYYFWGCLDYSGISALIFSSTVSLNYYLFYCEFNTRLIWSLLIAVINLTGIIGPMTNWWMGPKFRPIRTGLYMMSGAFVFGPLFHYMSSKTAKDLILQEKSMFHGMTSLGLFALPVSCFIYICGATLYVCRIPERFAPGKFDILFHSHQFWHCTVFLGAFVHLNGLFSWVEWRKQHQLC